MYIVTEQLHLNMYSQILNILNNPNEQVCGDNKENKRKKP